MNGMIYQANALLQELKSKQEFEGLHSSSIYYLVLDKLNPKLPNSKSFQTDFGTITITQEEGMEKLNIDFGDTIEIVRSGDVIPRILKVIKKTGKRLNSGFYYIIC